MKKTGITLMVILITAATLFAQTKMNALKIDLLSLLLGVGVLKYERVINENTSVQVGVFYSPDLQTFSNHLGANGYGIIPEFW